MKYKGIELTPITEPQIFDPPKEMLVWDCDDDIPEVRAVLCIVPDVPYMLHQVLTTVSRYRHCAEIPEKPKPKRATHLQLAQWLAKGNGMWRRNLTKFVDTSFTLHIDEENRELEEGEYLIRPFGTDKWLEPTLENMGMEDK